MATITGTPITVQRIETGLYTLDHAFEGAGKSAGKLGLPCHSLELYGPVGCGKTTVSIGLAGILAQKANRKIVMMDIEGNDTELILSNLNGVGFEGEFYILSDDTHEKMLKELADRLATDEFAVAVLDSVGAIKSIAEDQGDIGDRNMGHRGFIMAQFSRRMNDVLRGKQKSFFAANHQYQSLGKMTGIITPGGDSLKYLAGNRIPVKRKETFDDGSYVVEGTVKKNRFGLQGRKFYIAVLAGQGVHLGLTALYDCAVLGLVERGKTIKMGGQSFGYLKALLAEAHAGNNEAFQPFIDALKGAKVNLERVDDDEGTE